MPPTISCVVSLQVSVTDLNGVLGAPGVPLMGLLWAAVAAGKDIEATRFRGHAVSQLMRRFCKEVRPGVCVCRPLPELLVPSPLFFFLCASLHAVQYYEDREALLHYYIQPFVVEEVPPNLTTAQFVAQFEKGVAAATKGCGINATPSPLAAEATAFLASTNRLLLLLGEPGSGKSMFTWLSAVEHMAAFQALASSVGGEGDGGSSYSRGTSHRDGAASGTATAHPTHVWIPVVIDLKHYRTSELLGLLPRALQVGACTTNWHVPGAKICG
jgi:hypothetical protein